MTLLDFLVRNGPPGGDWMQLGCDFIGSVLDGDGDVAAAVKSIVPARVSLPQHSADGLISAISYVDIGNREVQAILSGVLYAAGWRNAIRAGASGASRAVPPRAIGFGPH